MRLPGRIALVPPGPIAQEFVRVLAGLQSPPGGTIRIGEHDLSTLPRRHHARRIAYAGVQPVLFPGTLRDNILYGLRVHPLRTNSLDLSKTRINEAVKTGNPCDSVEDPWIDFERLGVSVFAASSTSFARNRIASGPAWRTAGMQVREPRFLASIYDNVILAGASAIAGGYSFGVQTGDDGAGTGAIAICGGQAEVGSPAAKSSSSGPGVRGAPWIRSMPWSTARRAS